MGADPTGGDDDPVAVTVPTFRPDIRPAPHGRGRPGRGGGRAPTATPGCPDAHRPGPSRAASRPPARASAPQGRAVRAGGQRGVDHRVRDRGRPAGRRLRAAVRRDHQSAGGGRALPAVVDGAGAPAGAGVQRRTAPGRRPPVRGRLGVPPVGGARRRRTRRRAGRAPVRRVLRPR